MMSLIKNQHGNALWFILLAVALLGFLTALISRSGSSVDQTGNVEQARIKASALLRYTKSIENAVDRMVMNGISENDLDFAAIDAAYDNTNCSTDDCNIFETYGGGVALRTPAQIIGNNGLSETWRVSTANRVGGLGCDDANRGCTELLLTFRDIPQSICLQVNKIQDATNPSGDAPRIFNINDTDAYTGAYTTSVNSYIIGGTDATEEAPQLARKSAGCFYEFGSGQNTYHFYQVLLAR